MDKTRFTRDPQLDAEGFLMADAKCHGCRSDEMCSRSGYCERYDSPLRYAEVEETRVTLMLANAHLDGFPPYGAKLQENACNARGPESYVWLEARALQHTGEFPPLALQDLMSCTDEELDAMHRHWMAGHETKQVLFERRKVQRRQRGGVSPRDPCDRRED